MKYFEKRNTKVYTLVGDAELAEGSNWEALNFAWKYNLNNFVGILDCNRLGQSDKTSVEHHLDVYEARFKAFGFYTQVIDGHDIDAIANALWKANEHQDGPSFIIAKTFKGKGGLDGIEDSPDWHGKPLGAKSAHTIEHLKSQIKNPHVKLIPRAPHKEEIKEVEHVH